MFFEGETFDDILQVSLRRILADGVAISPSKGDALEIIGACIKLNNPRARFSRTEHRAVVYSALGETLWYLSGSDDFDFIEHYIPHYRDLCGTPAEVQKSEAAYGPRWQRQMDFVKSQIQKQDTRRAIIAVYREDDQTNLYDVPCTCVLQFFPRAGALHALAQMRSNDAFIGMAHDVFAFTLLQEILARSAGLELGTYTHQVGSLHLYEAKRGSAENYLASGIADTVPMDPMPVGNPNSGLNWLLKYEAELRTGGDEPEATGIDPYWQDLARLLKVRERRKAKDAKSLETIRDSMHSNAFRTFIQDEIGKA